MRILLPIAAVLISIIFLLPLFEMATPSGRAISKKKPVSLPVMHTNLAKLVDSTDDAYKLIFASTDKGGQPLYIGKGERRVILGDRLAQKRNFAKQLNQAGAQGYQLVATSGKGNFAITRLKNIIYEYDWFETNSKWFFTKTQFEEKLQVLSRKGFSLIDHLFISSTCKEEPLVPHDAPIGVFNVPLDDCTYLDWFLVEREKDAQLAKDFKLVRYSTGVQTAKTRAAFVTAINNNLSTRFYPTHLLSKFEALLQPSANLDKLFIDKPEVLVVTEKWQKMQKKVNELAGQGYRLFLIRHEIALMYRPREKSTPFYSYSWVYTNDANLETELIRIQKMGGRYSATCPGIDGDKNALIFELPSVSDGLQREYKTFRFELSEPPDADQRYASMDLTPISKDNLKTINQLAKEGFQVKDLFDFSDMYNLKAGALLERVR